MNELTLRIGRREFTAQGLLLLLSGVTVTVSACGGNSASTPPTTPSPTPSPAADATGVVSANHGHVAGITAAQITAANTVTLNIQGTATHPHSVDLTAAEVARIGARQQVAKDSSNNSGHQHTITFN